MELAELLNRIKPLDKERMIEAQRHLDNLTKPIGSLGHLETIAKVIRGISCEIHPQNIKKGIIIMCADNGVVVEGVSSCPKEVTATVTENFSRGFTGVNVLSRLAKADLFVVDMGVDADLSGEEIINRKIRNGTWNMANGPAMTRNEAIKAINIGVEMVTELKNKGYNLIGTGEMGIGNTTTSSAICAVLTNSHPREVVGRGAGLSTESLENKVRVVERAIEVNLPDKNDPIDVLTKIGGFDIAGLVGCFIGAAINRVPIVMDGIITYAAALLAIRLNPTIREYIFASHASDEPCTDRFLNAMETKAILNLGMRLGEGTGSALGMIIIEAAMRTYFEMGTFNDAKIEKYIPLT